MLRILKQFFLAVWEVSEVILISIVTVLIIRTFLVQPFLVSGASMEPNFSDGNYLLVDEITYRFREPQRGEVVVFKSPQNKSVFFIKRIVALPGEQVTVKNNKVYINGEPLNEEYLASNIRTAGLVEDTLGKNEYLVFGDNRYNSFDSRNWGPLKRDRIIGLARLRLFPFSDFEIFGY